MSATNANPPAHWRLVARKEIGDLLGRIGARPLARTIGVVAVFGIFVPLRFTGMANLPAFFALFMAFLPARLVAIDAFAGERERGTLEALLASPLRERAIVGGKLAAATAYGAARGWLFLAMWSGAAWLLRVTHLAPDAILPSADVALAAALGSVVIAYAASVFGLWQSARAPSVRAIMESGGLLRLVVLLVVFFVVPWLFGLFAPDGRAPALPLPGAGDAVSLDGLRLALSSRPGLAAAMAAVLAAAGLVWFVWMTFATLRRGTRAELALVTAPREERSRRRGRR